MLPPKGYVQTLSKEAYTAAAVTAAKKSGVMRFTLPVEMGAAALTVLGVWTIIGHPLLPAYWITGGLAVAAAAILLWLWLAVFPRMAREQADKYYALYMELYDGAEITFTADEMTVKGKRMTRRVEYAKTRLCVETSDRFVILTDDDAAVILEKACFSDPTATSAFLRDVFARWYTGKR